MLLKDDKSIIKQASATFVKNGQQMVWDKDERVYCTFV